jgi:hypothetical protein
MFSGQIQKGGTAAMASLPPSSLAPCPACGGQRVGTPCTEGSLGRTTPEGVAEVCQLRAIVCVACGQTTLAVDDMNAFRKVLSKHPQDFALVAPSPSQPSPVTSCPACGGQRVGTPCYEGSLGRQGAVGISQICRLYALVCVTCGQMTTLSAASLEAFREALRKHPQDFPVPAASPAHPTSARCPACGGQRVGAACYECAAALKGGFAYHTARLHALVCSACGQTSLFLHDQAALQEALRKHPKGFFF